MTPAERDDHYLLVHAYCDGELDPVNARAVEAQIAADPKLAAERDRIEALRRALRSKLSPQPMPRGLRERIESAAGLRRPARPTWNALAASLAAVAVISSASTWYLASRGDGDLVLEELTASHTRALMTTRVADVASSDRHTVKPWFSTRTAQAPRIVDLTSEGFPLLGGRLDVIGKIPVPTLVYGYRQHVISLTALPRSTASRGAPGRRSIDGLSIVSWSDGDMSYWAVSDVGPAVVDEFVQKFRSAPPEM